MPILKFPPHTDADTDGLLAFGGDLEPASLLLAYRSGIFPWPLGQFGTLAWFSPPTRAVLRFSKLHIPQSLKRRMNRQPFRLSIGENFGAVIQSCAQRHQAQDKLGTWITPELSEAYIRLHHLGFALSAEAWDGSLLVGGVYGVYFDGKFAAESMFYYSPDASKLALIHLIDFLKKEGLTWIDIQVMTPHMKKWGAEVISRDRFLKLLIETHAPVSRPS